MSKKLRWGILATGGIAHHFTRDIVAAGHNVTAVGSRSQDKANAFAKEFDIATAHGSYEDLVADSNVDAIYVATPHPMHVHNAKLALEAGKHVLIEKPFTINAGEAAEIAELAKQKNLAVLEAMWTRFLPHMIKIREIIASGLLGEITSLNADHTQALSDDPAHRLNAIELGGSALMDLGIYPISFIWDILGEPTLTHAEARFRSTGADAHVSAIFRHSSGAISSMLASSEVAGPNRAQILGTKARIEIEGVWYAPTSFRVVAKNKDVIEEYRSEVTSGGKQFEAEELERLVAEGKTSSDILPLSETVAIMETLDAIRADIGLRYPWE
ncbi:Gfo/Idh/MocA family oxidoreductase [Devosia rhodophyticola]|uniref:Gfo/Idh/MocA family oxidoreductase n=1 Tax=Devosia rhodophyticola TaxID=3026423 RepID=A0ABY7YXP0_9HYPH|nr:Gfo/Idh/MocA family oxidoreductase [Devosia rhodophyticola]WDR06158.1 Gfo/Idh/MocA family oxidoreductase [Devosia rhodophyticola]